MKKNCLFLSLLLSSFLNGYAQNWTQVWADEFNGASIESGNWNFETGGGGHGNNELENYTSRGENATVKNGNLLIIARKESYQGSDYTSARMTTQGKHDWTYGKVEARIKIPTGKGIWPAFWMLGSNINSVNWPECGEIDIMEHVNTESKIYGTIHWNNNGHAQYGNPANVDASTYHTYSIEWDENAISWFVDATKYGEANIANNANNTAAFHKPFFILLNLAVGGQWPGNPDNTTSFPDTMYVDYVRVSQKIVAGVNESTLAGSTFSVYPNPSSGASRIEYTLAADADVVLELYDAYGKKTMDIASGHQAAGSHQLPLNTGALSNGLYFVKASINGKELVYKVIKN